MPLTVKFRDIEKDILDAVRCGRHEDESNLGFESDNGYESDEEERIDDGNSTTMSQHQLPNHGKGIPLRPLAPNSGANLLSSALLDMLSDIPQARDTEMGNDVSAIDQNFMSDDAGDSDDLEKAFADW
jgi:hypothetical protein